MFTLCLTQRERSVLSLAMARGDQFDVVGFDADDTMWRSEDYFTEAEELFVAKVGPYAPEGIDVLAALHATELGNVPISGYGVKAYALSMVQAAVTVLQMEHALAGTGANFLLATGAVATTGGMTATGATGATSVRSGMIRENVLGLTVVMVDGSVVRTGTGVKNTRSCPSG